MARKRDKRFTKLEKILVGIILFFIIGFLSAKYSSLFIGKENLLRLRYNKYVSLINDKKYLEAYGFLNSSAKSKLSLEDFSKNNPEKQTVVINKIALNGDIGYIDRNNSVCVDDSCGSKIELRGYKKWVFENGNWYYTYPDPRCIREKMYDMPLEFERALSLIKQRFNDYYKDLIDLSFFNCVDVEYGDVGNAEGSFTFVENSSNIDRLSIKVDKSYVNNDDLITAFLLVHETTHASTYLNTVMGGTKMSCVDDETNAFYNQLVFSGILNQEERESVNARLRKGYQNINNQLKIEWDLFTIRAQAERICGTILPDKCLVEEAGKLIKNMITSNPFYQKQCGLN